MRRTRVYRLLIPAMLGVALSACGGVPLSTLWHFRNFGPRNLVQTDAAQVRIALRSWSGLDLNGGAPQMHATVQFKGGQPQSIEMPTVRIIGTAAAAERLPNPESGREWYLFKFTPKGIAGFHKVQQLISEGMGATGKLKRRLTLTLRFDTSRMHPSVAANRRLHETKKIPIQIRLELSPKEGYYTLYSGKIPVKYMEPSGHDLR